MIDLPKLSSRLCSFTQIWGQDSEKALRRASQDAVGPSKHFECSSKHPKYSSRAAQHFFLAFTSRAFSISRQPLKITGHFKLSLPSSPPSMAPLDKDALWKNLSAEERSRQEAILELVSTEQTFLDRLVLIYKLFYEQSSAVLTDKERVTIFQNLEDIILCNGQFLEELKFRQAVDGGVIKNVADVFIKHIGSFAGPYRSYCLGHDAANQLLNTKLSQSKFGRFVKERLHHPLCAGLDLASFLLEPVQRLARYPLLFKQILHYTEKNHEDHVITVTALQKSETLAHEINEAVRESENQKKLDYFQHHLVMSMPLRLDLQSPTRSIGPRKFLHEGPIGRSSKKKIIGILFNDLLILATKSGNALHLYRQPFPLDELVFTSSTTDIRLSYKDQVIELTCDDSAVLRTWQNEIEIAKRDYHASLSHSQRPSRVPNLVCIGTVRLTVLAGLNLLPKQFSSPLEIRPYCVVCLNGQRIETTSLAGPSPFWNQSFIISVSSYDDFLSISVHNHHKYAPNELLGSYRLGLDFLEYYHNRTTEPMKLELVGSDHRAAVTIQLFYKPVL